MRINQEIGISQYIKNIANQIHVVTVFTNVETSEIYK